MTPNIDYKTFRDRMARTGMLTFPGMPKDMGYEWAKGKSVGEIENIYARAQKSKLSDAQKSAVKTALGEMLIIGTDNKVASWGGFMQLARRAQEIANEPISVERIQSFINSKESGEAGRSFQEFNLRASQSNQKLSP